MPPGELFDVELFDVADAAAPRLPARVTPLAGEALASWLLRFARPFGISPEALLLGDGEADLARQAEWWRKPDLLVVAALSRGTGLSAQRIQTMTFANWADDLRDDMTPDRFGRRRYTGERSSQQGRRIGVCPHCLAEDETPYIRRAWTVGWTAACAAHGTILLRACPDCGAKLRLPTLASAEHFAPDRCGACACRLSRATVSRVAEPLLWLQRLLFEGRADGIIRLPDVGEMTWPVAITLCDVLLGAVWIDTKSQARGQLFARIARDVGGEPLGDAADGSAGMTILAWVFQGWPARAQAAHAMLRAVRPRRQIQRWPHRDAAVRDQVEKMLNAVWPDERHGPERTWWRGWIDGLSETGDELRARAARERLPHRRVRLLAIADVRDGQPVEVAADVAGVQPKTLYRWLRRGAQDGLEAALQRPSGVLGEPQRKEIADWIAEASPNAPRWRANRVQNEVRRRYGMDISIDVAHLLLRTYGPWRRRKVFATRKFTVAPVYN